MPGISFKRKRLQFLLAIITCLSLLIIAPVAVYSDLGGHAQGYISETPGDYASVSDDVLSRRWPNGIVYYTVVRASDAVLFESDLDRLNKWEEMTEGAVRFIPRTVEPDYIEIQITNGATQTNGLRGKREADGTLVTGKREIFINPISSIFVNHELGHTLGMWHQQRHPDSNLCIRERQESAPQLDAEKFIGHYSTNSVMHYLSSSSAFQSWYTDSTNPTICSQLNSSTPPTEFDVKYIHKMYGTNGSYRNHTAWCSGPGVRAFTGDFNGDGLTDLLCHTNSGSAAGFRFIDYANPRDDNVFGDGDWSDTSTQFCTGPDSHQDLHVGDFNGDGRDDLLCHNKTDGRRFIDFATASGRLIGNVTELGKYCATAQNNLYIGDFNGDETDDMLCHTKQSGVTNINYGNGGFWTSTDNWCSRSDRSIIIGDFDGDARSDMVCHDKTNGRRWINYADTSGHFGDAEWNSGNREPFCQGDDRTVYALNLGGSGRDDLLCHNRKIGSVAIDFSSSGNRSEGSQLNGANIFREVSFCNAQDGHFLTGRLPIKRGRQPIVTPSVDSLFCHNSATGHQTGRHTFN